MANTPFTTKIPGFAPADYSLDVTFTSSTWNTTGNHQLAVVSGLARVLMLVVCTSSIVGSNTIDLKWENGANSGYIGYGYGYGLTSSDLTQNLIWGKKEIIESNEIKYQGRTGRAVEVPFDFIINNADIIYSLGANWSNGTLRFLFWFYPLESGATFTIGNGS